MVVKAARLVVGPDNYRVLPVRPAANGVDYARHLRLASPDVSRRMFAVFQAEIHERYRRQLAR